MTRSILAAMVLIPAALACATSPNATPSTTASPPVATQAASPTPAVAATMNPVGTYDFTATLPDGSEDKGIITISGSPGAYTGTIQREGTPAADLISVAINGQTMTLGAPYGPTSVTLTLGFNGPEFSGKWSVQGAEGAIRGKRR